MNNICSSSCGICDEINGNSSIEIYNNIVATSRNIVAKTDNFLLIPSIGPLNESHVMLVPKQHVNSFSSIQDNLREESRSVLYNLNNFIKIQRGKTLIFFESGAGEKIDHSGGCIYHAHIHCIYYTPEFEKALKKEIKFRKIKNQHLDYDKENGYVWYMNNNEEFVCNNPLLRSQFLRYLYYNSNSISENWNWRRDHDIAGVSAVIENYKKFEI